MEVDRLTTAALLERTAARFDAGQASNRECSVLKLHASEAVGRIADRAVQVHGGTGYIIGTPVERMVRDSRILTIGGGATEVMLEEVAKRM